MPGKLPKLLIVDANVLFSFFEKGSTRRRLINQLSDRGSRLLSPDFVLEELTSNEGKIMKTAKIDRVEFSFLFSLLERKVETIVKSEYEDSLSEAGGISPHEEETKDDPYFALAMSLNAPIWSDEKEFKEQSQVKVLSTRELLKLLES